ncbi:hypothetical protein KFE25_010506 [Diacronema lutheri]|uniref:PNPLA domain-containing protein n=2 Tax=Diacronema lutheri TaxID=2081491 RepID=A0A8J6C5R9_DIALT|nr:hypothetical protein KFE25_010506 [Diacronema lutheri]
MALLEAVSAFRDAEPRQLAVGMIALLTALCLRHGTYTVLRVPLLIVISLLIAMDLAMYVAVRCLVKLVEWVTVVGYKRRDRRMRRSTYAEWMAVGSQLDCIERLDQWKADPVSRAYNWRQVQAVTRRLRDARQRVQGLPHERAGGAVFELKALLLPTLVKNYAGTMSAELYSKTHVGTKRCVELFLDEVCACVEALRCYSASSALCGAEMRSFWRQAQISFGNCALLLSGGAMMGIYHYGVIRALVERSMLPRVISGTSAGSVIAAFLAVRTDEEVIAELRSLDALYREQGSDGPLHGSNWWKLRKLLVDGVLYSSSEFEAHLGWFTRGLTFREAFVLTGRVVCITCTPHKRTSALSPPLMLNHITAPNVTIASAVCASSCVPGLIPPVELAERCADGKVRPCTDHGLDVATREPRAPGDGGGDDAGGAAASTCANDGDSLIDSGGGAESIRMRDGSFEFDIPKHAIAQMFNVHFTIVSQVNPHILPFTYSAEGSYGQPNLWRRGRGGWRGGFLLSSLEMSLKEDMLKWLRVMRSQKLGPVLFGVDWSHVFLQDNQGDITLSPSVPLTDYINVINNAHSRAQIERMVAEGEQITWRAMPMLEGRLRIQKLLDEAIDDPLLTSQPGALSALAADAPANCDSASSAALGGPTAGTAPRACAERAFPFWRGGGVDATRGGEVALSARADCARPWPWALASLLVDWRPAGGV